ASAIVAHLNLNDYKVISEREEHLVVKVGIEDWNKLKIGDALYGIPYHICPTVALYDEVQVVEKGEVVAKWKVEARKKKINI
ncbi:MAG: D-TA family PLP-dependent enzyme, partial [Chitinophagaceae bacterium]